MSQHAKPPGPRNTVGVRLLPRDIERLVTLAAKARLRPSSYAARVLEAHIDNQVLCQDCGHQHPIHRPKGG